MIRLSIHRGLFLGVLTTLTTAAVGPLTAQPEETIPRRLALALLGGLTGQVDIRVGEAVPDLPKGLVPDGADVLGSVISPTSSNTIVAIDGQQPDLRRAMESVLAKAGWIVALNPVRNRESKGFIGSGGESADLGYCLDGRHLRLSWMTSSEPASVVGIAIERVGQNICSMMDRQGQLLLTRNDDSPVPAMAALPGTRTQGYSGGGDGTRLEYHGTVIGRMPPVTAVLKHYSQQLEAAGWTASPPDLLLTVWRR
ncbi:MAG: hypothetical protein AB7L66_05290 [Gemmatimonadales bacterium]